MPPNPTNPLPKSIKLEGSGVAVVGGSSGFDGGTTGGVPEPFGLMDGPS